MVYYNVNTRVTPTQVKKKVLPDFSSLLLFVFNIGKFFSFLMQNYLREEFETEMGFLSYL